jgi:hypothetical protein
MRDRVKLALGSWNERQFPNVRMNASALRRAVNDLHADMVAAEVGVHDFGRAVEIHRSRSDFQPTTKRILDIVEEVREERRRNTPALPPAGGPAVPKEAQALYPSVTLAHLQGRISKDQADDLFGLIVAREYEQVQAALERSRV